MIYKTCLRDRMKSLMSKIRVLALEAIIGLASMLATIFNLKITKTEASFLAILVKYNCWNNNSSDCSFNNLSNTDYKLINCNFFC